LAQNPKRLKKNFFLEIIKNLKLYNFKFITKDKKNKILEFQHIQTKKKLLYIYSTRYPEDLNEQHVLLLQKINKLYISGFKCDKSTIEFLSYRVTIYVQANYSYDEKADDILNNLKSKEIVWNVIVFKEDFAFDYNFGQITDYEQYKLCKVYKCEDEKKLEEKSLSILYLQKCNDWFNLLE
jgi:hypothetical protein